MAGLILLFQETALIPDGQALPLAALRAGCVWKMPGPFRETLPGSAVSSLKGFLSQIGQLGPEPSEVARMERLSREPVSALAPLPEVSLILCPGPLFGDLALQDLWLFLQCSEIRVYLEVQPRDSYSLCSQQIARSNNSRY